MNFAGFRRRAWVTRRPPDLSRPLLSVRHWQRRVERGGRQPASSTPCSTSWCPLRAPEAPNGNSGTLRPSLFARSTRRGRLTIGLQPERLTGEFLQDCSTNSHVLAVPEVSCHLTGGPCDGARPGTWPRDHPVLRRNLAGGQQGRQSGAPSQARASPVHAQCRRLPRGGRPAQPVADRRALVSRRGDRRSCT